MNPHASRGLSAVLYAADLTRVAQFYAAPASVAADGQVRRETPNKLSFAVADLVACRPQVDDDGGSLKPTDAAWTGQGVRHLDGVDPERNLFRLRSV